MSAFLVLLIGLSSPHQGAPRVVVAYQGVPGWEASLVSALGEKGLVLFGLPADLGGVEPLEWARRHQMDLLVDVATSSSAGRSRVRYQLVEVVSGDTLSENSWEAQAPDPRILASSFWIPLVSALDDTLGRVQGAQTRLRALPGTLITGLTVEPLVVGDDGVVSVPVRVPGVYPFRASHPERQPLQSTLAALQNDLEVTLDQKPLRQWTVEVGLIMGQYPTLGGRYHLLSDQLWVGVSVQQYFLGWILDDRERPGEKVSASFPLLVPSLAAGWYFLESDAFLRPFVALEIGPRLWFPKNLGPRLDPLGFLQFTYEVGSEWAMARPLLMNLRLRVHHYLGPSQYAAFAEDRHRFGVVGTRWGIFQFPILYGGLTWSF